MATMIAAGTNAMFVINCNTSLSCFGLIVGFPSESTKRRDQLYTEGDERNMSLEKGDIGWSLLRLGAQGIADDTESAATRYVKRL